MNISVGRSAARHWRSLDAAWLSILLSVAIVPTPTKAQLVIGPSCSSPILCTGLVPEALSIYATMPDANGVQQVTTSFRVVNHGPGAALPSTTLVKTAGALTYLATPSLAAGAMAFFSTTVATTATDFAISVTTANNNAANFHFVSNAPALGRWRPLGPSMIVGGRSQTPEGVGVITAIAVDPSSASIVYAGARGSGLWKTTDGGAHWEPLTDALPTVNIYATALDSTDPQHVFIATPSGVFGSTNGGNTWSLLNSQDFHANGAAFIVQRVSHLPQFLAAPATDDSPSAATGTDVSATLTVPGALVSSSELRLYLTTQSGLLVSRDGGVSWLPPVLGSADIVASLEQDRANADHLLAAVVSSNPNVASAAAGVYETFTGGLTPGSWHQLKGCPGAPAPDFSPAAFKAKGQIWATMSGSTQWISDKAPLDDGSANDHELWRTTDQTCTVAGFTEHGWQLLSSGIHTPCISADADGNAEWSYLRADPTNSQVLYKAGIRLCRSTDAGATFQEVQGLHVDHHALVFHPTAPTVLLDGNDGGLYRSGDSGQTWRFNAEGLAVTEFLDIDHGGAAPRVLVGGSQDNEMSSSDLTSPVWHLVDLGSDIDGDRAMATVDPVDPAVQYTMGGAVDHFTVIQNGFPVSHDATGLPTHCITYNSSPSAMTQFIATTNPDWHLLTTVGPPTQDGPNCNGGLWTGPPWRPLFVPAQSDPSDQQALRRIAYDANTGLFLAGGNGSSVYAGFSPDVMAKVWTGTGVAVNAIVPDPARTAHYFVALNYPFGVGRVYDISPSAPLQFGGQDITADLPGPVVVATMAANRFEPGVLYAGTSASGVFRGVRDANGNWKWHAMNNGLPQGAVITKLRMGVDGTLYAGTWGRGAFALDTVPNTLF